MSTHPETARASSLKMPQKAEERTTAALLMKRLQEAESQMAALRDEIDTLRESLRREAPDSLAADNADTTHPSLSTINGASQRLRATNHDVAFPLFQPEPEALLHAPASQRAMPISATMGAPMPAGFSSPGPETPPPMLFEPEELSPRQQAISAYHQQPFFVDAGFVSQLSPEELDDLPYGVIQLDAEGRILAYNDTEARLAGYPKERVVGRNFFAIAPCTRVREFEGRFRDLAEGRKFSLESFEFVFNFKHGAQRVLIMIFPANRRRGVFNIALIRR